MSALYLVVTVVLAWLVLGETERHQARGWSRRARRRRVRRRAERGRKTAPAAEPCGRGNEIEQPQPEPAPEPHTFTRLDITLIVLAVAMAIAGVVGLIAVLDADNGYSALGIGFGIAWTIFLSGGT